MTKLAISGPTAVALEVRTTYLALVRYFIEQIELKDTYRDIILALSWRKKTSDTIPGTILSPAADAKPDRHLAASRDWNESALAVQMRMANKHAMDTSRAKRLPNLAANGTQNMFPIPRRRKFNYRGISILVSVRADSDGVLTVRRLLTWPADF